MDFLEGYLKYLYTDNRSQAKEWRGANIPYGDDSDRPNLIGKCMALECDKMKINCLRKLRDQAAMNPFYQYRIDRFVDAITQTYEPTEKPGTIPGSEFKTSGVGDDTHLETLSEIDKISLGLTAAGAVAATTGMAMRVKKCKKLYSDDKEKYKKCLRSFTPTHKLKKEQDKNEN